LIETPLPAVSRLTHSIAKTTAQTSNWVLPRRRGFDSFLYAQGGPTPVKIAHAGEVRAPLVEGQNDFRDAEAIAEAMQRPTMNFIATNNLSS